MSFSLHFCQKEHQWSSLPLNEKPVGQSEWALGYWSPLRECKLWKEVRHFKQGLLKHFKTPRSWHKQVQGGCNACCGYCLSHLSRCGQKIRLCWALGMKSEFLFVTPSISQSGMALISGRFWQKCFAWTVNMMNLFSYCARKLNVTWGSQRYVQRKQISWKFMPTHR